MNLPPSLRSRYEVLRTLGKGGYGEVILAIDRTLHRPVAIKLLFREHSSPEALARFEREARLAVTLKHPHIVEVYEFQATREHPFLISEYIEGETLKTKLTANPKPSYETVRTWAQEIAEALDFAHSHDVLHRDVKPDNILISKEGRAVLCDFGIARRPDSQTVKTMDGLILGTPAYIPPEVWAGASHSPAADQFAWAATFLPALGTQPIYPPGGVLAILDFLKDGYRLPPVLSHSEGELGAILRQSLAESPSQRFPSMRQASDAITLGKSACVSASSASVTLQAPALSPARSLRPAAGLPAPVVPAQSKSKFLPLLVLFCFCGLLLGLFGPRFRLAKTHSLRPKKPNSSLPSDDFRQIAAETQKLKELEEQVRRNLFGGEVLTPWDIPRPDDPQSHWEGLLAPRGELKVLRLFRSLRAWLQLLVDAEYFSKASPAEEKEAWKLLRSGESFFSRLPVTVEKRYMAAFKTSSIRSVKQGEEVGRKLRKRMKIEFTEDSKLPDHPALLWLRFKLARVYQPDNWKILFQKLEEIGEKSGPVWNNRLIRAAFQNLSRPTVLRLTQCDLRSHWRKHGWKMVRGEFLTEPQVTPVIYLLLFENQTLQVCGKDGLEGLLSTLRFLQSLPWEQWEPDARRRIHKALSDSKWKKAATRDAKSSEELLRLVESIQKRLL